MGYNHLMSTAAEMLVAFEGWAWVGEVMHYFKDRRALCGGWTLALSPKQGDLAQSIVPNGARLVGACGDCRLALQQSPYERKPSKI
jgi:hypothetical protein